MNLLNIIKSFLGYHEKAIINQNPINSIKLDKPKKQNWTSDETNQFKTNLIQVVNWTNQLAKDYNQNKDLGLVFRSINPKLGDQTLWNFEHDYAMWNFEHFDESIYPKLLDYALKNRSTGINRINIHETGRILSFETCISTVDGAPIIESQCFVDECDVPPIDTWFYLKKNYSHNDRICSLALFCWIPKQFEPMMQAAINVEILDSYRWLDENDPFMFDEMKNVC